MRTPSNAVLTRMVNGIGDTRNHSTKQRTKSEHSMKTKQPQCTKRRYTKEGAQMALLETQIERTLHHSNKRKETRAYYHPPCKAWHLTKLEKADNGKQV